MDVGTVLKREVTWVHLKKALADTTLNLGHEYVQYIRTKQRRSLCIIYETVATQGDTDLDSDSREEGLTILCFILWVLKQSGNDAIWNTVEAYSLWFFTGEEKKTKNSEYVRVHVQAG